MWPPLLFPAGEGTREIALSQRLSAKQSPRWDFTKLKGWMQDNA